MVTPEIASYTVTKLYQAWNVYCTTHMYEHIIDKITGPIAIVLLALMCLVSFHKFNKIL